MADKGESFVHRIQSDLSRIRDFLMENEAIIDAHNVDFFTQQLWETCLSEGIRTDLDKLSEDEIGLLPVVFLQGIDNPEGSPTGALNRCKHLLDLFSRVRSIHLRNLSYVEEVKYFKGGLDSKGNRVLTSFMMSPKKAYEVDVMSQAVYDLVQRMGVSKVVDLGSGKGYLSQYLALKHRIPVLGIDSRETNTTNAARRNEKTLKVWHCLLKRSQNPSNMTNQIKESCNKCGINPSQESHTGLFLPQSCSSSASPSITSNLSSSSIENTNSATTNFTTCDSKGTNIQKTGSVPEKDFLQDKEPQNLFLSSSEHNSYFPVTAHVSSSAQIHQNLEALFKKKNGYHTINDNANEGIILVGLHTCGDLAPTAINIFIKDPFVKALCLVGCCYHLLSQQSPLKMTADEIEEINNSENSTGIEAEYGFPMSNFLKQQNFKVSRNATMVAQQAADRIASECKIPPRSIFYRAILQVILKEKFGLDTKGMHVGRVGAKCKTFTEYVHKTFKKLDMENQMISDEEIQIFYQRFQEKELQIRAFHQFRACIAPCIESLFLMDRLCYLHEKGISNARIVAMFDPVKSPRCYAIIASKTS